LGQYHNQTNTRVKNEHNSGPPTQQYLSFKGFNAFRANARHREQVGGLVLAKVVELFLLDLTLRGVVPTLETNGRIKEPEE
jgi:hypothetical protein